MGPSYYLVTLNPVSREELRAFILDQGGEIDVDPYCDGDFFARHGRLSVKWATNEKVDSILAADNFVETKRGIRDRHREYETLARIADALGGPPHDFVLLSLLSRAASQHLAVRFADAFVRRWTPCVLETDLTLDLAEEGKNVWTMDDAFRIASKQRRLPTGRHDIADWSEYFRQMHRAEEAEGLDE